ncbi:MAG TPA: carboxypeptidase regulatory-like domain-containing protein [Abditibacteriaceae bacterium]|jgi:hypothetical protein
MRFFSKVRSKLGLLGCLFVFAARVEAQPLPERTEYRGQILNSNGLPIGGAAVTLRRQNDAGSMAYWGGLVSTDARGSFEFADAETGSYYISIEADGFAPIQNQAVEIGESNSLSKFELKQLASFRVKIVNSAGVPQKTTAFSVAMKPGESRADSYWRLARSKTNAEGIAEFNAMMPGAYEFIGVVPGEGYFEQKKVELAPGKNATVLNFELRTGATMKVAVKNAAGKALGGVQIVFGRVGDATPDAPRQFPGPEVQIYGSRGNFVSRDGDGTLEITDLAPGTYRVSAKNAGASEIAPKDIVLEAGKTVELAFTTEVPPAESVTVKIVDAKGAPRANGDFVLALARGADGGITRGDRDPDTLIQARSERRIRTNENGIATLFPVAVGKWQISARREIRGQLTGFGASTTVTAFGANQEPVVVVAQ